MVNKYNMRLNWILGWVCIVVAKEMRIIEKPLSKDVFTQNFKLLFHLLELYPPVLINSTWLGSIQFVNLKFSNVTYVGTTGVNYRSDHNMLVLSDPGKTFSLHFSCYWVYTIFGFSMSGKVDGLINVYDVYYELNYSPTNVTSELRSILFDIERLDVTGNFIANLIGIPYELKISLKKLLKVDIVKHLKKEITSKTTNYMREWYPHKYNSILSYYDYEHTINYQYNLSKTIIGTIDIIIHTFTKNGYSHENLISNLQATDLGHYNYYFPLSLATESLSTVFNKSYSKFNLTNENITSDSLFKLNGRQFAQVLPDFYMLKGNVNLTLNVEVVGHNIKAEVINKDRLRISGLVIKQVYRYEGETLLEVYTTVSGEFSGILLIHPGDNSGLINLAIQSLKGESSSFLTHEYKVLHKEGFKRYFQGALDNWIKPVFNKRVLGNGIYVEDTKALDSKRSKVVFENGFIVALLNLPS